jgi:hypothetical protein
MPYENECPQQQERLRKWQVCQTCTDALLPAVHTLWAARPKLWSTAIAILIWIRIGTSSCNTHTIHSFPNHVVLRRVRLLYTYLIWITISTPPCKIQYTQCTFLDSLVWRVSQGAMRVRACL